MAHRLFLILLFLCEGLSLSAQTRDDVPRRIFVAVAEGLPPGLAKLTAEMLQSRYGVIVATERKDAHTVLEYAAAARSRWECRVTPFDGQPYVLPLKQAPTPRFQMEIIQTVADSVAGSMGPVQPEVREVTVDPDERTANEIESAERARLWYSKSEILVGLAFFSAEFSTPKNNEALEGIALMPGFEPKSLDVTVQLTDGLGGWRHGLFARWGPNMSMTVPKSFQRTVAYQDYGYSFGRLWRVGSGPVLDFYLEAKGGMTHYKQVDGPSEDWLPIIIASMGFGIGWDILPFLTLNLSVQAETGFLTVIPSGGILRDNQIIKVNVPISVGWRPGF